MRALFSPLFALALALPAFLLTNHSFRPFEARFHLDTADASYVFDLPSREPLFLEYVINLRSSDRDRPKITVELNGRPAATIAAPSLYASHQDKILLSLEPVHAGRNELRITLDGRTPATFDPSGRMPATFDLDARLHNYSGIAPDFPRLAVVADETVANAHAARPLWLSALTFVAFYAGSMVVLALMARATGTSRRSTGSRVVALASPSIVLWAALAYSLATPLHIWLSLPALGVAVIVGAGAGLVALWVAGHRAGVLRFAAVTAVSLVALEIALRLFNLVSPSFVFYSDAYSRYRGKPGAPIYDSHFNSRGFNDVERSIIRPPTVTRRIVAIGDSFAVGVVPYRANYLTLLQSELASDGSTEVVNMGVAGTEPRDYLGILVNEGLAFKPDLVLVGFFVGNDFETPRPKLYEHSYVATLANALWKVTRNQAPAAAEAGSAATYNDAEPSLSRDRFMEIEVDRAWVYAKDSSRMTAATRDVAGDLKQMRDIAKRSGADFAVVLIPDEAQINMSLQAEVARASGHAPSDLDFAQPNRLIASALGTEGIKTLDLLPTFQEAGRGAVLYKPQDTHWNLAGNQLAAKTIAIFLK
jgi:hypothetical protein